jgi:hypothetical protein
MRRTIVDNTVTQGDVVSVVINPAKAAACYIEAFEDVVI